MRTHPLVEVPAVVLVNALEECTIAIAESLPPTKSLILPALCFPPNTRDFLQRRQWRPTSPLKPDLLCGC